MRTNHSIAQLTICKQDISRVRRHIGEDAQLVDVRVIFRRYSLELRMDRLVACARRARVSIVDRDVGIAHLEIRHVVIAGQP